MSGAEGDWGSADDLDLAALLRAGDTVLWSHAGAEPLAVIRALLAQRHALPRPLSVLLCGLSFSGVLEPEHADALRFKGIGGLGTLSRLTRAGQLDVLPVRFADMPGFIATRRVPVDVAIVSVTPPDSGGQVSLGSTVAVSPDALAAARVRIAQVNPRLPFIGGPDALVPLDSFDRVVYADEALPEALPARTASAGVDRICQLIADYVADGSTLQLGIGSVADRLPAFLRDRRHLGIHSAILTDGLVDLIEAGVADNSRKETDTGVSVGGELVGTRRLYDFADRNPAVALRGSRYLLDPPVLGRLSRLVSVNSALEVDLTGQVNAETVDGRYVGAIGGQVDFVHAAAHSPDGVSVIALAATRGDGRSRIVAELDCGSVTTARSEVDVVITEHGAAELRGRTLAERARALIAVAHPDHRDALSKQLAASYFGGVRR